MKKDLTDDFILRDISWLSFNARVLQEAADKTNALKERIRFLGIFSNNLDEFFRVRVATLSRMIEFGKKSDMQMYLEKNPKKIMAQIHQIVLIQQNEFTRIWNEIISELKSKKVFIKNEKQLNKTQQIFVRNLYDIEVENNIIPLMIESIVNFPALKDKAIYLAVKMSSMDSAYMEKFAVIEVPSLVMNRFIKLPSTAGQTDIILLEDVVRFNLKNIFTHMGYNTFESWIFKVTRDAEIDIDNDVNTNLVQKIEFGLRKRKKAKTVRLVYDREMDTRLLNYLVKRLHLQDKGNIIPGGRIHNYRDFMEFPNVFSEKKTIRKIILHPSLKDSRRVTDQVMKKDILLSFPYHTFDSIIDMLRESAMDADVVSIHITAYRLASNSKVMNALINASRNGKKVTVMIELRARFDEEANLKWKEILEEEGIKVLVGIPDKKVHCKICVIKKRYGSRFKKYGFISTGNLNEKVAKVYSDFCLLTSNPAIMNDIEHIFKYLEQPKLNEKYLSKCTQIITSPLFLRQALLHLIDTEIKHAKNNRPAKIIIKVNSLSDNELIEKLYEAAKCGVEIDIIARGIFCMKSEQKKTKHRINAISIVDEYLEHARVFWFLNGGQEKTYISSADWMMRNVDFRLEVTCPINNKLLVKQLKDILNIQLNDNQKARILDNQLSNQYRKDQKKIKFRSQVEILKYLEKCQ